MELLANLFYLSLPETKPRIENSPDFGISTVTKVELTRSKEHKIGIKIQGDVLESCPTGHLSSTPLGTVIKGVTMPTYVGKTDAFDYTFEHCFVEDSHPYCPDQKRSLNLEPHRVRKVRREQVRPNKYIVIYFLNGVDHGKFNYQHRIQISEKSATRAECDSRILFEQTDEMPSWVDVQRFDILGHEAYFGQTPKQYSAGTRTSFLIIHGDPSLESHFILSISRFLSLLFGTEFVSYGNAKLDIQLRPNWVEYVSIQNSLYREITFDQAQPILPTGIEHHTAHEALTETYSALANTYLKFESVYHLNTVTWYIIQSNRLPLELRVQPLASAFDSLMAIWNQQKQGPGKPKYISDKDFAVLVSDLVQEFDSRLDGNPNKAALLNKFKSLNEIGYVQQAKRFLLGLGIEPSRDEVAILKFRHKIVHGSAKPIDSEVAYRFSNGFRTLLVRTLLKMLGYQGSYLDYASLGFPARKLEDSIQVGQSKDSEIVPNP